METSVAVLGAMLWHLPYMINQPGEIPQLKTCNQMPGLFICHITYRIKKKKKVW